MSPEQKQYERAFEIIEAYGADSAKWPQASVLRSSNAFHRALSYKRIYKCTQPGRS